MAPFVARRRVFALLALLSPVLLFGALEGGLRIARYKGDLGLFASIPNVDRKYLGVNPRLASRYFASVRVVPTPPGDLFLRAKPAAGFRVFVLGESSTAGFPYGYNGTFSRVVRDALRDVLPQDTVEFVNLGISAITSYALFDTVDEILSQHPDAVLIYAGHNEFYGALGAGSTETVGAFPGFVRAYLGLQRRFKTVVLARDLALRLAARGGAAPDSSRSLMQQMVREELIPLDSPTYQRGTRQFRENLQAMLQRFDDADVPVFVASLTSNLRDQQPFRSLATDSLPAASQVFEEARQALAHGKRTEARPLFERARDLDALRFRAAGQFNSIIRAVAEQTGAHYVPVDEAFAAAAEDGIPGLDLFWEHLHPNQTGYHLIGKTFFEAIARAGFLGHRAEITRLRSWPAYYDAMELTEFDRRFAWHQIRSVTTSWPFVEREDPSGYPRNYRPHDAADSAAFEVVIYRRSTWPLAKFQLAAHYRSLGQLQPALAEYRGLIREQPENPTVRVYAADLLVELEQWDGARDMLERAYALQPSALTSFALGRLELQVRHVDRAINLLTEAQRFQPDVPAVLYDLSRAYTLTRDMPRARALAQRLAEVSPGYPGLSEWLAELATMPD
jgi:tetratricopeptide (TPR) repeat protein